MISIDIGTHSIKLLKFVTKHKQGLFIETFDIEYINNPDKEDQNFEQTQNSLQKLILRNRIKNKSANICISDCLLIQRNIKCTSSIIDDIEKKIHEDIKTNLSHFFKEKNISFRILSNESLKELNKPISYDILIGGIEKHKIDNIIKILNINKIKFSNIEASPIAQVALNIFNHAEISKDLFLYLDIGFTSTKVIFVINGMILFTKNIPVAGKYFTQKICEELKISYEEAEKWKLKEADAAHYSSTIKKSLDNLAEQIKLTLNEFNELFNKNLKIKQIYLTGGGANLKNLNDYLARKFFCIAKNIDIFSRIKPIDDTKLLEMPKNIFSGCLGMATNKSFKTIKSINFLPMELRVKRLLFYRYAYVAIIALLVLSGVIINIFFLDNNKKPAKNSIEISSLEYQKNLNLIKLISDQERAFDKKDKMNDLISKISISKNHNISLTLLNINRVQKNVLFNIKGISNKKELIESYIQNLSKDISPDNKELEINKKNTSWEFNLKFRKNPE